MILPNKYLKLQNSLLNLGAIILNNLTNQQTVTLLWDKTRAYPEIKNFERFTMALDFLFTLDLIDFKDGLIVRKKNVTFS